MNTNVRTILFQIVFSIFLLKTIINCSSKSVIIDTPSRHEEEVTGKNPEPYQEPIPRPMQDSFYEQIYWKYHCNNEKPDGEFCKNKLNLDSSMVLFLSTNGDKKDCFIINTVTSSCGCYEGSSGAGFVFFKRKSNGTYYVCSIWGFSLKQLTTSHNGIYDVSYYHRRANIEYFCYWNGKKYEDIETYAQGIPADIFRKVFTENDTIDSSNAHSFPQYERYDTIMLNEKTKGILIYAQKSHLFRHEGGINYKFIQAFEDDSLSLNNIQFSKTKTNGYFDVIINRYEKQYTKQADTIVSACELLDIMTWQPKKKKYEFSHKMVDTCYQY
jgi:hypothetical protein